MMKKHYIGLCIWACTTLAGLVCRAGLVEAVQTGSIANFFMDSPARVEQYDLSSRQWLPAIALPTSHGTLTAGWIDDDGIYAAYGVSAYRYDLSGNNEIHLTDEAQNIIGILVDGNILFLNRSGGSYARFTSVNKDSNTLVDAFSNYVDALVGASIAPSINKMFGRSTGVSPSDICYVTYNSDGTFVSGGDSSYHGDYPGASKTWVFPDDVRVVDSSGTIYSTSGLIYLNSFGSGVKDIAFYGDEIPIVLYQDTLTAYAQTILPTGDATLDHSPDRIFIEGEEILTFTYSASAAHELEVHAVALSELNPPIPGDPIDPTGLAYTPDGSFVDNEGILNLFSRAHQSIFRWDTSTQQYTDTIPLVGVPKFAAYSADNHEIYLAYDSGLIRAVDLTAATPTERPFANLPSTPYGLSTADQYVFAVDPSGAWESHHTFAPDGSKVESVDWRNTSYEYVWCAANQKMYYLRDDTSPNDVMWEEINADGVTYPSEPPGGIGNDKDSPLHTSTGFSHPIRVAPDGSIVVLGSGVIHDGITLARLSTTLTNGLVDIAWLGNDIFTTRTVNGNTQYQKWMYPNFEQGITVTNAGTANRLIAMDERTMVGISINDKGIPVFRLLISNLDSYDTLQVDPNMSVSVEGYVGLPFMPSNLVYTLVNVGTSNLHWSATAPAYIVMDSSDGWLSSGETTTVHAAMNPDNAFIPPGEYAPDIVFYNHGTARERRRTVEMAVYALPEVPAEPSDPAPSDNAAGVGIDLTLDWVHINGTDDAGPWDTASRYSVFLGTNQSELVQVASGLTNTVYDPGLLEADTTYYWQVSASNVIGVTAGPVWSFTTWVSGPLDHFDWGPIASNQQVSIPFDVVVTAKDVYGDTVLGYNDFVPINGYEKMTDGAYSMLNGIKHGTSGNYAQDSRGLRFRVDADISITHLLHYRGTNICLWADDGELLYEAPVTNTPGSWSETELVDPIPLYSGMVYRVSTEGGIDYRNYASAPRAFTHGQVLSSCYSADGFPSSTYTGYTELTDFRYAVGHQIQIAILPTNAVEVVEGVWTGKVVAAEYTEKAFLRVETTNGLRGDSSTFRADYIGDLAVSLPGNVAEGDGILGDAGEVTVSIVPASDIVVALEFEPGGEAAVPAEVIIPAGETNVLFDLTVLDDAVLDGSRTSVLHAASFGYKAASTILPVHDNESTVLNVALPQTSYEGAGSIDGAVIAGAAPVADVVVHLISNKPSKIGNGSAILPAGQTFASFTLPVYDDAILDGVQTVTIEARVENWQSGYASVFVFDDETNGLDLQLPGSLIEGEGTYADAGLVQLPAVAGSDVYIQLTPSDETELSMPDYVIIPAGTNQIRFDVAATDDTDQDGTTTVTVLAQAPGYIPDLVGVSVLDNDPHHFLIEGVTNISLRETLNITITARTLDDARLETFNGAIALTASGNRGDMNITPATLTNIKSGGVSAAISFETFANDIALTAIGGGVSSTSDLFNVFSPLMIVSPDNLTNTLVVAGETATRTMTISNAGNANLEYVILGTGGGDDPGLPTNGLVAHFPFNGNAYDESGNGHNGTVSGATLTSDRFGQANSAYSFDGVNDLVIVPDHNDFTMADQSICAWIKTTKKSNTCILSSFGPWTYYPRFTLRIADNTGRGRFELDPDYFAPARAAVGTTDLADGGWHFVVGIRDSAAGTLKIFVDGVLQNTAASYTTITLNPSHDIWIGGQANGASGYFSGAIDDVRIYNKVLSDLEVMYLYNEIDPALLSTQKAWLAIDPATGTVLPGESTPVAVTFDASKMAPADGANTTLTLLQNMRIDTNNAIEVSMWAVPPAPFMADEPEDTMGTSNEVFWSAVDGLVQYQVEATTATNAAPEQQSDWLTATNHTFASLSTNTIYYYRVRASVISSSGMLAGPWSGWTWSTQITPPSDADGDGIPDAWELRHFGNLTTAGALTDFDGDGQSDLAEFIAGMIPTNAASCFSMHEAGTDSNGYFVVYWDSVSGRVYNVLWAPTLTNDFGQITTNSLYYPQNSYTDQVQRVEQSGFYKVGVELE